MLFSRAKRLPYNARKRLILAILEQVYSHGLQADVIAWKVGVFPKRAVYGRLNRLTR